MKESAVQHVALSEFTYDPDYFAPLFAVEDRHFWFRARNRILAALFEQLTAGLPDGYSVLEVGCGTGNVLRVLERVCTRGQVVGMDLFRKGLSYASLRVKTPLVQGDMHCPPFGKPFEMIGLFDVLEHLPNDVQVLRDLRQMLCDDGRLVLTVPAHMSLWSYFDAASHHVQRYELHELQERLLQAGFEVEYLTPYMAGIFPIVWLGRRATMLLSRGHTQDEQEVHRLTEKELQITPLVNPLLEWVCTWDTQPILKRRVIPFGTSLLAIARKRAS